MALAGVVMDLTGRQVDHFFRMATEESAAPVARDGDGQRFGI
jgi:hypothetical protein